VIDFPEKDLRSFLNIYAAQQTLSKAREQAIASGAPYFTLITSTPFK